jgi:hypothetical protein
MSAQMLKFIEKHLKNDETIFWSDLASCHYAKNEAELSGSIKRKLKEIDVYVVQTMMKGVRTKLRKIADTGRLAVMCK